MATPPAATRPTPERIFNTLNAYQHTAALRAAIELDIFTAIAEGANDAAAIAKKTRASERGVRILCDYLTILGFLTKEKVNDKYSYGLSQDSRIFLDRHSPAYMGISINFLSNDTLLSNFSHLAEVVKKGGSVTGRGDNEKPNDEMWVAFARSMGALSAPTAAFIAELTGMPQGKSCQILDVAAGHGIYGITMARQNPNAKITAVDWPKVLEVAQEHAREAGLADRYQTRPGSAFETDLGTGYDFVLLTNIFHHFDPPTCEKLMKRAHAALRPGGQAVTLEFVTAEDRVSPPTAAMFSMIMLATTDAGDAYTFSEYEKMFSNAGFAKTIMHPVPGMPQQVLISQK